MLLVPQPLRERLPAHLHAAADLDRAGDSDLSLGDRVVFVPLIGEQGWRDEWDRGW